MNTLKKICGNGLLMAAALFLGALLGPCLFQVRTAEAKGAASIPEVLRASRFELVDQDGGLRASLRLSDTGEPLLFMYGNDGKVHLSLSLLDGEPGIDLYDNNSVNRLSMYAETAGAMMQFRSNLKHPQLSIDCRDQTGPILSISDPKAHERIKLLYDVEDGAALQFVDSDNQASFKLTEKGLP